MGKRVRQRTVYAATAVAVLSLVAGFAIASITTFNVTTTNQGSGSVNTQATAFTCATTCLQASLMSGSAAGFSCVATNPATVTSTNQAISMALSVASSGTTCKGGDFAEVFSFQSSFATATPPTCFAGSGCTDTFLVSSIVGGVASTAQPAVVVFSAGTPAASGTVTVDVTIAIDYGTGSNPGITSISVVANGQY